MLTTVSRVDVGHDDLIHDVAFDFYGQRMATCSSDQTVKVFDLSGKDETGKNVWNKNDEFKAHDASVLRVAWAHPEFGQVLATCSVDRIVRIWEEQQQEPFNSGKRWTESARLVESRETILDIKFAPKHMGLKLAVSSADGIVRIYEAMDVMNLARWNMMESFEVQTANKKEQTGGFCLSWCPSRFHQPQLVVGCGRDSPKIFRYNDVSRKWVSIATFQDFCGVVNDVAWAPNIGRDYHLIATACKDKSVRIFRLREQGDQLKIEIVGNFDDHQAEVWRVEWNVTGTVLSSSGDDGKVRLWKANYLGQWKCTTVISADDAKMAT